jgi:hypothetical protein
MDDVIIILEQAKKKMMISNPIGEVVHFYIIH